MRKPSSFLFALAFCALFSPSLAHASLKAVSSNGSGSGGGGSLAVTATSGNTNFQPLFATGTGATVSTIFVDPASPLTYNPSTGLLNALKMTATTMTANSNVLVNTTSSPAPVSIFKSSGTASDITEVSNAGLIISGNGATTTYGQLRITANSPIWVDSVETAYFQVKDDANSNLLFVGGTYGADATFGRLGFDSNYTQFTDVVASALYSIPVPTGLVSINSTTSGKVDLVVQGATGQAVDYFQVLNATSTVLANVTSSGHVGIGASTPADLLDVGGAIGMTATTAALPANGLYLPVANTLGLSANTLKGIEIDGAASTVNAFVFAPSTTGNALQMSATGSDTNITVKMAGKGTGGVSIAGTTTADSAATGYVGQYIASICPTTNQGPATITIASPAVITLTNHGMQSGDGSNNGGICPVVFTTSGALPTGITASTVYWTIGSSLTTNTFQIATSIANAIAGTAVNTSGSQSGTQTVAQSVPLSSNSVQNCVGVNLTPGDWDLSGSGYAILAASTTMTQYTINISNTSGTFNSPDNGTSEGFFSSTAFTGVGKGQNIATLPTRVSILANTPYYIVDYSLFSNSTATQNCFLRARRVR